MKKTKVLHTLEVYRSVYSHLYGDWDTVKDYYTQRGYKFVWLDQTSSAGDWTFMLSKDGKHWRLGWQEADGWPSHGYDYYLAKDRFKGTKDDVLDFISNSN